MNPLNWNRVLSVLAWAGVFVAGVLTAKHFMNLQLPCGYSQDCEKVANHPSSYWFGIPVALFGLGAYLTLAFLAFWRGWKGLDATRKFVTYGAIISGIGALVSIVLTFYSMTVIHATCAWCISSAVIMLLTGLAYAALLQSMSGDAKPSPKPSGIDMILAGCCAVLCIGLIGWRISTLKQAAVASAVVVEGGLQGVPLSEILRGDSHVRGDKTAPVTVVEYADFYCPTCRDGYPKLRQAWRNANGKMRMAFRHYPLWKKEGHELSLPAAVISEYAAQKGKFWQFVDAMFDADLDDILTREGLLAVAAQVGLDQADILKKIQDADDPMLAEVMSDMDTASKIGVEGTPTYLIYADGVKPRASSPTMLELDLGNPPYSELMRQGGPVAPPR